MATLKPQLIPYTWANAADHLPDIVERPPQDPTDPNYSGSGVTIDTGWVWGEKPLHKYFNYGWRVIDLYTHHINSQGIPSWDDQTTYEVGSAVLYNPYIYQANTQNTNEEPINPDGTPNSNWDIVGQFLANLDDTYTGTPNNDDILMYNSTDSRWDPYSLDTFSKTINVGDLIDIELSTIDQDDILAYAGKENELFWTNMDIREAISRDGISSFLLANKIQYKEPHEYDVLKYDGNIWKISQNVMESTAFKNVLNPPAEFQPPYATADVLGGAKIYSLGDTLNFVTEPQLPPGPPEDVGTVSSPNKIDVYWIPPTTGDRASFYNIYRDSLEIQGGVFDNLFTDFDLTRDREYVYYITSENKHGESDESNRVFGHTFSEPSRPKNLDYKMYVNDVELFWEIPDVVSGDLTYKIFRDSVEIGETSETKYTDKNLGVGSYTYFVTANNKYFSSENSNTIIVLKQ